MLFRTTIKKENVPDEVRTIEALSRFEVYAQVSREGGTVIALTEATSIFTPPAWLKNMSFGKIKHTVIGRMIKNLATMLSAGLSLSRALTIIERETSNKRLRAIATRLSEVVGKGTPFHTALAEYPKVFPEILIAMVKVGEESGSLSDSLHIVGLQMEHSDEITRKIKGAMIYPAIIVFAIMIVSILMMIYVVPTLTKTFNDLKVELPFATMVFVALSNFMVDNVILVMVLVVAGTAGLIALIKSRPGSAFLLRIGLHVPVVGELIRETYAARTARTLSSLLSSGVPVLEALSITKDVVRVETFANIIAEAEVRVKKGEPLSVSFSEHPKVYPILMSEMLAVGEETGKVTDMLRQVAEFYEGDVSEKTKDLSTIIEPVLMLLIGAVVGVFAISMIAPIYSISSAI